MVRYPILCSTKTYSDKITLIQWTTPNVTRVTTSKLQLTLGQISALPRGSSPLRSKNINEKKSHATVLA